MTEEEKVVQERNKKKKGLEEDLKFEFELEENREIIYKEGIASMCGIEISSDLVDANEPEIQDNIYEQVGNLMGLMNTVIEENAVKDRRIGRLEVSLKCKRLDNKDIEEELEVSPEERVKQLEDMIESAKYKIEELLHQSEQMTNKYKVIESDKLKLLNQIDDVNRKIRFIDKLREKEGEMKDPRYGEVEHKVRSMKNELLEERIAKDIVINELEVDNNKHRKEREKLSSEIADYLMGQEELARELEGLQEVQRVIDKEMERFVHKFQSEYNTLEILNMLNFLLQYIDTQLFYKSNSDTSNLKRFPTRMNTSVNDSETLEISNIEKLFQKDKENNSRVDMSNADDTEQPSSSPLKKFSRRTTMHPKRKPKHSTHEFKYVMQSTKVEDHLAYFTKTHPEGPDEVANHIIQSFKYVHDLDSELKQLILKNENKYKEKTDLFNKLNNMLTDQKRLLQSYEDHRKKADHSYVENFEHLLNEEDISKETNLININPSIIRLDPNKIESTVILPPWPAAEKDGASVKASVKDTEVVSIASRSLSIPQGKMINYSANILQETYPFILPDNYDKVRFRNVYIVDLYNRMKMIGNRLFDTAYLARYIVERKIGTTDNSLKAIDKIIAKSEHYVKSDKAHLDSSKNLLTDAPKAEQQDDAPIVKPNEAPGKMFIKLKTEASQIKKEDLETMMLERFGIPSDYLLIREILSNEIIKSNTTVEDIKVSVERECEKYEELGLKGVMTRYCYLNHVCDSLFATIYFDAISSLAQKLYKVFKDIENLLKETFTTLNERQENPELKNKSWKPQTETLFMEKYPKGLKFEFESHIPMMGATIKPFQRAMDKLFLRDKVTKKALALQHQQEMAEAQKQLESAGELAGEDNQPVKVVNVDNVRKIVTTHLKNTSKRNAANSNKPVVEAKKTESRREEEGWERKKQMGRDIKEILNYGSTMNALHFCFENKVRDLKREQTGMPSIVDSHIKGRNPTQKIRNLLTAIRGRGVETILGGNTNLSISLDSNQDKDAELSPSGRRAALARIVKSKISGRLSNTKSLNATTPDHHHAKYVAPVVNRNNILDALNSSLPHDDAKRNKSKMSRTCKNFTITTSQRGSSRISRSAKAKVNGEWSLFEANPKVTEEFAAHRKSIEKQVYLEMSGISKEEEAKMSKDIESYILNPF